MNTNTNRLDNISVGFGISLVVSMFFNTILACIKDVYDPLNRFMALLFGHHWITHGIFDIFVFIAVGIFMMRSNVVAKINPTTLIGLIYLSALVSITFLVGWFFLY